MVVAARCPWVAGVVLLVRSLVVSDGGVGLVAPAVASVVAFLHWGRCRLDHAAVLGNWAEAALLAVVALLRCGSAAAAVGAGPPRGAAAALVSPLVVVVVSWAWASEPMPGSARTSLEVARGCSSTCCCSCA